MSLTEDAIDRIADLGQAATAARFHTLPNGQVTVLTGDGKHETLLEATKDAHDLTLAAPSRIKTAVTIQTADSLVDYIARFKTGGTILFADIAANAIKAVLDYHEAPDKTAHSHHVATLRLPFSEEWKTWTARDGKLEPQLEFARFLRENNADITAPDAATLIEVVKDIQAIRNVNFTKAVRLNSDNESFEFVDNTTATSKGGSITIPEEFALRLPVYFGGETVGLKAWLRWKLADNQLGLGLTLHRAEHVRQAVFKEIVADIAARAEVPAVFAAIGS